MVSPEVQNLSLPRHLVLILDGNGRWAQKHRLPILEGHARGGQAIRKVLYELENLDIEVVTVWGFSTENWSRSEGEVAGIMSVMEGLLESEGDRLIEKGYRFRHVGRKDRISNQVLERIDDLERRTLTNTGKTFVLALDYGGRDEITRAVNKAGGLRVDEETFKNFLDTGGLPDPDLIIRTSGEMRTSGIYTYQGIYAEFTSSPVLLPDFDKRELLRCLEAPIFVFSRNSNHLPKFLNPTVRIWIKKYLEGLVDGQPVSFGCLRWRPGVRESLHAYAEYSKNPTYFSLKSYPVTVDDFPPEIILKEYKEEEHETS